MERHKKGGIMTEVEYALNTFYFLMAGAVDGCWFYYA